MRHQTKNNSHPWLCAHFGTNPQRTITQHHHPHRLDPELLPQDFDPEYGVGPPDGAALEEDLFGDLIGCNDIKLQLRRTRSTFIHAERRGRDPREVRTFNSEATPICFSRRQVRRDIVPRLHIPSEEKRPTYVAF